MKPYCRGILAELVVLVRYLLLGYFPLATRWRSRGTGEIDLIVCRLGVLVFIEVKARSGPPCDLVHPNQLVRIRKVALHFLGKFPKYQSYQSRIDFAFVNRFFIPKIIENAWLY